jgi:hypothetical protein
MGALWRHLVAVEWRSERVTEYLLHLLDRRGRIIATVELRHDTDEAAEAEVAGRLRGGAAELWRGEVLVRKFLRVED